MKQFLLTTLAFLSFQLLSAQINFVGGDWDDILASANDKGQYIFVDVYASWCGPCKYMSEYVFTEQKVASYFNRSFVNVQVDAEQNRWFAHRYQVNAYPTLLILDSEGNIVARKVGAMQSSQLLAFAKNANE